MGSGVISGIAVVIFAVVGGVLGWRRGTRRIYWRSIYSDRPDSMTPAEYERRLVRRRKRWRLMTTILFALASAVVGCIVVLAVALRR
jgi:hypothetical protein